MTLSKVEITLISQDKDRLLLKVNFPENSGLYAGHFPGFPLLPGVVQMNTAMRIYEKYYSEPKQFNGLHSLKFFYPILPGREIQLEINYDHEKKYLKFNYFDQVRSYSKGSVVMS